MSSGSSFWNEPPKALRASGNVMHPTPTAWQMPGVFVFAFRVGAPLNDRPWYVTTVRLRKFASAITQSAPKRAETWKADSGTATH